MQNRTVAVFWFRRDLRLEDNAGLYHALKCGLPVLPVFIFDTAILDKLEDKEDRRLVFIHQQLEFLHEELKKYKSTLLVKTGKPLTVIKGLSEEFDVKLVFANHDYEPYARMRDDEINKLLQSKGVAFQTFKDQVVFEKNEVLKDDGTPYTVFTPYSRKYKSKLNDSSLKPYTTEKYFSNFYKTNSYPLISLKAIGFKNVESDFPEKKIIPDIIKNYNARRNYPALNATSRMSVHLRFGTISVRKLASAALKLDEQYLNELIWREFYMMILWHFPHVVNSAFKKQYDRIKWRNNEKEFELWCLGKTGYPIVDAGMNELNKTGFMHNRLRMIVASFLTKHLLIDWRWGEAYFAQKLLDFELSSNNGGWQWAAGSGCDAAPYFRIFNPTEQTKKFDADLKYIRLWLPEFEDLTYPKPIVEHSFARDRCLSVYKKYLNQETLM